MVLWKFQLKLEKRTHTTMQCTALDVEINTDAAGLARCFVWREFSVLLVQQLYSCKMFSERKKCVI